MKYTEEVNKAIEDIFTKKEIKALKLLAKEKIDMEEFFDEMYGRSEKYRNNK